jgi:hypothetical protein
VWNFLPPKAIRARRTRRLVTERDVSQSGLLCRCVGELILPQGETPCCPQEAR